MFAATTMTSINTKNKIDTSVIEITDDEDSHSPVKNSANNIPTKFRNDNLNNDEYRIGSNMSGNVCLSTTDMDLLDSSLNAKQEYVKAMQKLSQNLRQIETTKTPVSTAKLPSTSKSTGKFKFTKPKSAATDSIVSTPITSTIPSKTIPTTNSTKISTIPAMFKSVLNQTATEKKKEPIKVAASSNIVEKSSLNQISNGASKIIDVNYSSPPE